NATALRICQRRRGAPGRKPIGCQVCVSQTWKASAAPVNSQRPCEEDREGSTVCGNDRTSCHVSVFHTFTPVSWPLAKRLVCDAKDKVVAGLGSVATTFRE